MAGNLQAAIAEAYATSPSAVVYLDTLQLSNPDTGNLYLVNDRQDWIFTLETGQMQLFRACAFQMALPAVGTNGLQELSITIDNVNREPSDFVSTAKDSHKPVTVTYRPYLAHLPTQCQMIPPLQLSLTDISINAVQVSGTATFADILNKKFLTANYVLSRFPTLGGGG